MTRSSPVYDHTNQATGIDDREVFETVSCCKADRMCPALTLSCSALGPRDCSGSPDHGG
jgi:hypothetical protein